MQAEVINATENFPTNRTEEVREKLRNISYKVRSDFCEMADLLYEAWEGEYHKDYGYGSFYDYVEQELDIKNRTAGFYIQTAKKLNKLQIPWDEVREIGWRKTATIAPILTEENSQKWIEKAKETNLDHLSEKVKSEKNGEPENENPPVKLTIKVDQDSHTIIQAAIEHAKQKEGVKSNSEAISKICYDWVQDYI